jgi:hypothetical protein
MSTCTANIVWAEVGNLCVIFALQILASACLKKGMTTQGAGRQPLYLKRKQFTLRYSLLKSAFVFFADIPTLFSRDIVGVGQGVTTYGRHEANANIRPIVFMIRV